MRQLKISSNFTTRTPIFEKFVAEAKKYSKLSPEEEVETNELRLNGATPEIRQKAKDKLVLHNLRFVISVAKQYTSDPLLIDDYIANGYEGLIEAAGRFDHTRGFKFISFAVWWIRQGIMENMSFEQSSIRLPSNIIQSCSKVNKFAIKFHGENEREPTVEEISEIMGIPESKVIFALRVHNMISNDSTSKTGRDDEDKVDQSERLPDNGSVLGVEQLADSDDKISMLNVLLKLVPQEYRELISMVYDLDKNYDGNYNLQRAADHYGLSKERIRQKLYQAIKIMRGAVNSRKSRSWVKEVL